MTSLVARTATITGADLSGTNGAKDRTYTLPYDTVSTTGMTILASGVYLQDSDYDQDNNELTFLNEMFDSQEITINYNQVYEGTYCTHEDVTRILTTSFSWSSSTNPTETQINEFIEAAEDEIDNITQHAWRAVTVTNEYYDLPIYSNFSGGTNFNIEIHLRHREIRDFDTDESDKIEIWNGSSWIDWISTKTEGRANSFWQDNEQGLLFLKYFYPHFKRKALRMSYRFGASTVPNDIRDTCAKMVAIEIIRSDDNHGNLDDTGDNTRMTHDTRVRDLTKEIEKTLQNRQEFFVVS